MSDTFVPGGDELAVAFVADRDTERLLGGSIVGGVCAKRVDTAATALSADTTLPDPRIGDLASASPSSPVPVLTSATILGGRLE